MKIMILLTTLLFMTSASAGILIEPQLGYVLSNKYSGTIGLSGPAVGTATTDYKATAVEYGARVGYQFLGFMGGLNYSHESGKSKNSDGTKDDITQTSIGLFAGYSAPILVRAWFAYNLSVKADLGTDKGEGKSTEFGLGFTGLPFLSFNFIYRMYDFTKLTISGTKYDSSNYKPKEIELALSFPIDI